MAAPQEPPLRTVRRQTDRGCSPHAGSAGRRPAARTFRATPETLRRKRDNPAAAGWEERERTAVESLAGAANSRADIQAVVAAGSPRPSQKTPAGAAPSHPGRAG